jgi:hypothetical protein
MTLKPVSFVRLAFMLIFAGATSVYAQSTAQITGLVTDTSGAAVPGARITVTNEATGIRSETISNDSGIYSVQLLPPGNYRIDVARESLRSISRSGIGLQVAQAVALDFHMEVGGITETINVADTAPLLDASTNAIGGVVSSDKIENSPMKGRNSVAFMMLEPGVRMPRLTASQPVQESHYEFFSISGGRPNQNQFVLDGSNDTDVGFNGPTYTAAVDVVQEYRVETNTFSAEYGNFQGGVVNTVTKSGSNQLHGSAYEFVRNDFFEATDFFTNATPGVAKPSLKMNQFGATVGGPIRKNKTFFFFGYEGLRFRLPSGGTTASTSLPTVTTVPTPLQRAGDFSHTFNSAGALVMIYDPTTTVPNPNSPGNYTRTPFAGNIIPQARINPVAAAAVGYYPAANSAGDPLTGLNNFRISSSEPEEDNNLTLRIDHHFNPNTSLMGRYSTSRSHTFIPNVFNSPADPFNSRVFETHSDGVMTLNRIFSPTMISEFVVSFNRTTKQTTTASLGFDATKLGMPASLVAATQGAPSFPWFNISSMADLGSSSTSDMYDTYRPELRANLTTVSGKHTFKFGGLFSGAYQNGIKRNSVIGNYVFTTGFTQGPNPLVSSTQGGFGIASFLLGNPSAGTYNPAFMNAADLTRYAGLYFQDEFKINSRLTLSPGLRWDYEIPVKERFNRIPNFDFTDKATLLNGVAVRGGFQFPGVNGLPRSQWNGHPRNFGPRMGVAYNLTKDTVIRMGFGIFYGNSFGSGRNGNQVPGTAFGCSASVNASLDGGLTPFATISNPFPSGVCTPSGSSLGLLTALGQSVYVIDRNHTVPSKLTWNFDIQRRLPKDILFEVTYAGNRGLHLPSNVNQDQLNPQYLSLGNQLNSSVPNPYYGLITVGPLSAQTVARSQLLLPYPQYANVISVTDSYGASTYHAMYLKVERRFSKGFTILGSYSFSKIIDDVVSSPTGFGGESFSMGTPQNYYNFRADRSIATFNTPQSLVLSYVYELPFGPGKPFLSLGGAVGKIIGGWQINGITTFQYGVPLQISGGNANILNEGTQRPNWNGQNPTLSGAVQSRLGGYFNTSDFSVNAPFSFGNAPRIMPDLYGPGQKNFDFSLFKNTSIREKYRLQLRAEAFNATNRVQFGNPATNISVATFGRISTQANLPRDIQLGLKLLF